MCTGAAGVGTVLATFGVCSSVPRTPPTTSAAEGTEPFFLGLKKVIQTIQKFDVFEAKIKKIRQTKKK